MSCIHKWPLRSPATSNHVRNPTTAPPVLVVKITIPLHSSVSLALWVFIEGYKETIEAQSYGSAEMVRDISYQHPNLHQSHAPKIGTALIEAIVCTSNAKSSPPSATIHFCPFCSIFIGSPGEFPHQRAYLPATLDGTWLPLPAPAPPGVTQLGRLLKFPHPCPITISMGNDPKLVPIINVNCFLTASKFHIAKLPSSIQAPSSN